MRGAKDEDEARSLVAEEDRSKIVRVEKNGQNHVVVFSTAEETQAALAVRTVT